MLSESPVAVFFEKDLCPKTYVNSLYLSILKSKDQAKPNPASRSSYASNAPSAVYSQESLATLSASISSLVAHLDHHTNELSEELGTCIQKLRQNSASLGSTAAVLSLEAGDNSGYASNRLQYYISILTNSIINLTADLETVNDQINQQAHRYLENNVSVIDPISALGDLKQARENMARVLVAFSTLRLIASSQKAGDSYSTSEFESILNDSHALLHDELLRSRTPELVDRIKTLVDLLAVFEGSSKFYPIYRRFSEKLQKSLASTQE